MFSKFRNKFTFPDLTALAPMTVERRAAVASPGAILDAVFPSFDT